MTSTMTSTIMNTAPLTLPAKDGFYMPAEWHQHQQTWLLWPERTDNWRLGAKPAQQAMLKLAQAIAEFEPVCLGVSAKQYENAYAQAADHDNIRVIELSNNDAWIRDTGPTFLINSAKNVRGVDWSFNAWGGLHSGLYFPWDEDDRIARKILQIEGLGRYRSTMVLEGGAIHVDGEGTVMVTEYCLCHPNRNPNLSKNEMEQHLKDHLNVTKVLWLPRGIFNDETDEHIDNMACFIAPGEILLAWTDNESDPQYAHSISAYNYLCQQTDAQGRALKIHKIPIPGPLYMTEDEALGVDISESSQQRMAGLRLAGSYVNFYFCNGGIIMPAFDDPMDAVAKNMIQDLCPNHRVVQIPGREFLLGGGNIHCLTQQQPL